MTDRTLNPQALNASTDLRAAAEMRRPSCRVDKRRGSWQRRAHKRETQEEQEEGEEEEKQLLATFTGDSPLTQHDSPGSGARRPKHAPQSQALSPDIRLSASPSSRLCPSHPYVVHAKTSPLSFLVLYFFLSFVKHRGETTGAYSRSSDESNRRERERDEKPKQQKQRTHDPFVLSYTHAYSTSLLLLNPFRYFLSFLSQDSDHALGFR